MKITSLQNSSELLHRRKIRASKTRKTVMKCCFIPRGISLQVPSERIRQKVVIYLNSEDRDSSITRFYIGNCEVKRIHPQNPVSTCCAIQLTDTTRTKPHACRMAKGLRTSRTARKVRTAQISIRSSVLERTQNSGGIITQLRGRFGVSVVGSSVWLVTCMLIGLKQTCSCVAVLLADQYDYTITLKSKS